MPGGPRPAGPRTGPPRTGGPAVGPPAAGGTGTAGVATRPTIRRSLGGPDDAAPVGPGRPAGRAGGSRATPPTGGDGPTARAERPAPSPTPATSEGTGPVDADGATPVGGPALSREEAARLAASLAPKLATLPRSGRRGLAVAPPTPPFREAEAPFRWEVSLPSSLGRKVVIRVGDDELDVGGTVVPFDDIADARFKLDVEAALFRRAASARMTVALALKSGSTVRVAARNAASSRRATAIVETLTYLWTLLGDHAGADEREVLVGKIDRGAEVQVGRLRLTSIGIAWKREPIARWSTIGTPRRDGLDVVIPRTDGDPIVVPLTADDAYQLPALVPVLRKRFAEARTLV